MSSGTLARTIDIIYARTEILEIWKFSSKKKFHSQRQIQKVILKKHNTVNINWY